MIYIHGGAWRNGTAKDFAFPAEMFMNAGAHFVVPDFVQVQDAGGSLLPMIEQVRRAVTWVYKNAASFGGDAERIFITGHSSGAHLAGVTLVTDWVNDYGLPPDVIKGGLARKNGRESKLPFFFVFSRSPISPISQIRRYFVPKSLKRF